MGKTKKNIKHTRKVILLKYNDTKETLILSKTVKRRKEKLTIKVKCNTKIKKSVNECKSKERYPIFKAQLRERIVPCCFRTKCRSNQQHRNISQREKYKPRETKNVNERCEMTLSPISSINISDESNISVEYENISSGNLSSSTDEIETLMKSTRKRMKNLHDDWKLLPRRSTSSSVSNKSENINLSINSLDTLVLEAEDMNEYSETYDIHNDVYSPTMSSEKLIKYESIETNNNNIKLEHIYTTEQHLPNNNIKKEYFENDKIDAVVTKLEKNDMDHFPKDNIYNNNVYIKQELYSDI